VASTEPQTRFLVYSRGFANPEERAEFIQQLEQRFPVLHERVFLMHVPGEHNATFRDPDTARTLKRQVEAMLADEWPGKPLATPSAGAR
jgi:hypothetical protein